MRETSVDIRQMSLVAEFAAPSRRYPENVVACIVSVARPGVIRYRVSLSASRNRLHQSTGGGGCAKIDFLNKLLVRVWLSAS